MLYKQNLAQTILGGKMNKARELYWTEKELRDFLESTGIRDWTLFTHSFAKRNLYKFRGGYILRFVQGNETYYKVHLEI